MSYFFPPESLDSSINLKLQNSPLHVTNDKYILLSNVTDIYFSCFILIIPLVLESGNRIRTSTLGIQTLFLQVRQISENSGVRCSLNSHPSTPFLGESQRSCIWDSPEGILQKVKCLVYTWRFGVHSFELGLSGEGLHLWALDILPPQLIRGRICGKVRELCRIRGKLSPKFPVDH